MIEIINRLGSLFYGPVFGVFFLGLVTRTGEQGAIVGLLAGVGLNFLISSTAPGVSWLWWNLTGFAACVGAGVLAGRFLDGGVVPEGYTTGPGAILAELRARRGSALLLLGMFGLILLVSFLTERMLAG